MTFRVGQKVICINDSITVSRGFAMLFGWYNFPVKNEIYTCRSIGVHPSDKEQRLVCTLEGLINRKCICESCLVGEVSFNTSRFRPLVERKTSIEVFEKLLTPTSPREEEKVR
jgi:hypothetical protein